MAERIKVKRHLRPAVTKSRDQKKKRRSSAKTATRPIARSRKSSAFTVSSLMDASSFSKTRFPVVGIGASAGGLEALEIFFAQTPSDTGMAFVVITHQHPDQPSLLAELLIRVARMKIFTIRSGMNVSPDQIYLAPPGFYVTLNRGRLRLTPTQQKVGPHLPIDYFFRSLAQERKHLAIGVVLSGTGSDGTLGLQAIKGEGGMTIVQEPESAAYDGMPRSAINTGLVDYIGAPAVIPGQLLDYGRVLVGKSPEPSIALSTQTSNIYQKIFSLIRSRTGHDFSQYKVKTISRRIERRMNIHQIDSLENYYGFLQNNPHENDILFKELLIGVTSFFREAEVFHELAEKIVPKLLSNKPEGTPIRVWVVGTSTGEEAYSLAIIFREQMERLKKHFSVQIFATDLDPQAIEIARTGCYPQGIAVQVDAERLRRYFVDNNGTYQIKKDIREMIVFAVHNIISDPPFTKLDLLSCRNLLIYLAPPLQKRLLGLFHYALLPRGLLLLGNSESIGQNSDAFSTVDKKNKIFQRQELSSAALRLADFPARIRTAERAHSRVAASVHKFGENSMRAQVERLLLETNVPATLVVTSRGEIVYIHGRTGAFLEPATGQPDWNILEMARSGLRMPLASLLRQVVTHQDQVATQRLAFKSPDGSLMLELSARQISEPEAFQGLVLVSFTPLTTGLERPAAAPVRKTKGGKLSTKSSQQAAPLQRELAHELQSAKDELHRMIEEQEVANEELKSTNQELQSTNEELQSTNEELETSKEELQSLNEELQTVNSELLGKIEELSQSQDDMNNLLNATQIATLFLDDQLRIKRFTTHVKKIFNLIPSDVGRSISDIASLLQYEDMISDAQEVLSTLVFKEITVKAKNASHYLMRIFPYRTAKNLIDGLVVTFVDISELIQAQKQVDAARRYADSIVQTVREPLLVLDTELRVVSTNLAFQQNFAMSLEEIKGRHIYQLGKGEWNNPQLRTLLEDILPRNTTFEDFLFEYQSATEGRQAIRLNARRLRREADMSHLILLAFEIARTKMNQEEEKS